MELFLYQIPSLFSFSINTRNGLTEKNSSITLYIQSPYFGTEMDKAIFHDKTKQEEIL